MGSVPLPRLAADAYMGASVLIATTSYLAAAGRSSVPVRVPLGLSCSGFVSREMSGAARELLYSSSAQQLAAMAVAV